MSLPPPPALQADGYQAYLIRLWQAGSDGTWRVSLQSAQTGGKLQFAGLESLFAYLQAQTTAGDEGMADNVMIEGGMAEGEMIEDGGDHPANSIPKL